MAGRCSESVLARVWAWIVDRGSWGGTETTARVIRHLMYSTLPILYTVATVQRGSKATRNAMMIR